MLKTKIILFCLISNICFSQDVAKLDKKNGFKDLKFGEPKSKYINSLVVKNNKNDVMLKYLPKKETSLFGWKWSDIYLGFLNNKLGVIQVCWADNETLYNDILSNLETLYGKSENLNSFNLSDKNVISYNEWDGKNVTMTLRRYSNSSPNDSNCKITLIIENNAIVKAKLESDF